MVTGCRVGPVYARPGERAFGYLNIGHLASGVPLRIGVHVLAGAKPGPTLVLLATQHGDELGPLAVLRRVTAELDLNQLQGSIVIVPVANPVAFLFTHRSSWLDGLYGGTTGNLNRLWPGKGDGFATERMAHAISSQVLRQADFLIDFHATPADGLAIYYTYYMPGDSATACSARAMARAFGMEILMRRPSRHAGAGEALTDYVTRELETPAFSVELGDFYGLRVDAAAEPLAEPRRLEDVGATGTFNVIKHLGMLPGQPELPDRQIIVSPETRCMPSEGGILYPSVTVRDIGRSLPKGTVLGRVMSIETFEFVDEIAAPYEENLLVSCRQGAPIAKVNPGDQGFHVADLSTAEWVANREGALHE